MWPTANTFRAGHRIRLQVSSGAHPLFCRNAGTGEPLAHRRQPALGRPGGLPRRGRARRRSRCRSCRCCGGARSVAAEWVRPNPSASLPRMTQPTFVPIAEADQVRPARHLHVPGAWTTSRPAELVGPTVRRGRGHGHAGTRLGVRAPPGPALRARAASWPRASPSTTCCSASHSSRPSGPPSSAGRPASTTSRLALNLWGFLERRPGRRRGDAPGARSPPSPTTTSRSGRWSTPCPRRRSG